MWVEPDCVMPAGESLVRQLLYGQRCFRARFGAEHTVCWLPDCFGFTPALPQLLRGAGIERFFTIKLSWSETNRFPHDLFWWEGLDGSRVLAHLFDNPDGGYNGVRRAARPRSRPGATTAAATSTRRACCRSATATAAAGRRAEMAERARELTRVPRRCPRQRFGRVDEFFARGGAQRGRARRCRPGSASSTSSCTAAR